MITAKCITNIDPWTEHENGLTIGQSYKVKSIEMGSCLTLVRLEGQPGLYNSITLEFSEDGKPLDIFGDKRFNPYIR